MSSARTVKSGSPVRGRLSRSSFRRRRHSRRRRSRRRRSRSQDSVEARNSGNNLYIKCLPSWVTQKDVCELFSTHGKVVDCRLIRDPWTNESRGFAFVTMETKDDANRCIKYLHQAVRFDREIIVERAKRNRGWSPTPGKYRGTRNEREQRGRRTRSHSPRRRRDIDRYSRDQSRSPKRRQDRYRYSRDRSRSQTPKRWKDRYRYSRDRRGRSRSPKAHRRRRD